MFYCSYNVRCVYGMASILEMVILKFMLEEIELSYCLLSIVQIVNNKTIYLCEVFNYYYCFCIFY